MLVVDEESGLCVFSKFHGTPGKDEQLIAATLKVAEDQLGELSEMVAGGLRFVKRKVDGLPLSILLVSDAELDGRRMRRVAERMAYLLGSKVEDPEELNEEVREALEAELEGLAEEERPPEAEEAREAIPAEVRLRPFPPEGVKVDVKGFVRELRSILSSTPVRVLEVVAREAKDFRNVGELAKILADELDITEEEGNLFIRLLIMLRLVDYDEGADQVKALNIVAEALEPSFMSRIRWGVRLLTELTS